MKKGVVIKGRCDCGKEGHLGFVECQTGEVYYFCSAECMRMSSGYYERGKNLNTQEELCLFCGEHANLAYHTAEHPYFGYETKIYYGCDGCMPTAEGLPMLDYTYRVEDIDERKVVWEGKKGHPTH